MKSRLLKKRNMILMGYITSLKRELSVDCMEKVIETVYEIQEELANVTI